MSVLSWGALRGAGEVLSRCCRAFASQPGGGAGLLDDVPRSAFAAMVPGSGRGESLPWRRVLGFAGDEVPYGMFVVRHDGRPQACLIA